VFWAHALPPIAFYIPATLGVTTFFFLSGYLITTLLRRELAANGRISLGDFYLRRALRIFVPLYVVYALAAAFSHFAEHESVGTWAGFFSMLLYYYNYALILGYKVWLPLGLNVIWSLSIEEHFYLLFPLVYLALTRSRLTKSAQARLLIGFCALELVWRCIVVIVFHDHHLWTYYATDSRLDGILWGSVLALTHNPAFFNDKKNPDRPIVSARYAKAAFFSALVVLAASLIPRSLLYKEAFRYSVQPLALYVIFSFVLTNIRHPSVAWLEWKPLRYLGWTSYVLYLSHDFILNVLNRAWPARFVFTGVLGFAITLAFATVIRYTLELPLQRLRARLRPVPISQ
jgi:peptidoglycan/LPS O-acetylase OafA/YrhL